MEKPEEDSRDEELGLISKPFSRSESHRWSGYGELHPAVQLLDILQESTAILRKHDTALLAVALALAVPLSTLLLSHILLLLPPLARLVLEFPSASRSVAEAAIAGAVDVPLANLLAPLLKAAAAHAVAATYSRKNLNIGDALHSARWLLLQTFLWAFSLHLLLSEAALLLSTSRAHAVLLALAAAMACLNMAGNLAYVVCVLEGLHGREAMAQSVRLLRGKLDVAVLLFLVTSVNGTLLDVLFEFHIIRGDVFSDKLWEAPLLVCMHAFVLLFDAIMVSVLYFMCKATTSELVPRGGKSFADDVVLRSRESSPVATSRSSISAR